MGHQDYNMHIIKSLDQLHQKKANILVCWEEEEVDIKPGEVTEAGGRYALKALELATRDAIAGKLDAIVTAPLNKHNVNTPALPFYGHTEYLAAQAGNAEHMMMLVSPYLRLGLATGHVSVKDVSSTLSTELVVRKLRVMNKTLKQDFSLAKPKIAVLGLNPHAGDSGLIGTEEKDIIIPAVELAQKEGITAMGPYPADGFFGARQHEKFDAVLAMYHDQGLVLFKYVAFDEGVNFTAGLPFVRTSPDHGTAYNIAGKNSAREDSFRNAIYMAIDIVRRRSDHGEYATRPLPFSLQRKERFRIDF
jgi:4-hydroxythreonine-4-phosphate dehydrogenase